MKMTSLHMEFVLIFITSPSRAKVGRTALQQLLTLDLLVLYTHYKSLHQGMNNLEVACLSMVCLVIAYFGAA